MQKSIKMYIDIQMGNVYLCTWEMYIYVHGFCFFESPVPLHVFFAWLKLRTFARSPGFVETPAHLHRDITSSLSGRTLSFFQHAKALIHIRLWFNNLWYNWLTLRSFDKWFLPSLSVTPGKLIHDEARSMKKFIYQPCQAWTRTH